QLQLVLTLGEAREIEIDAASAEIVRRAPTNLFLRDAFYSGLFGRESAVLAQLNAAPEWGADDPAANAILAGLVRGIFNSRNPDAVGSVLALIAALPTASAARQIALLDGAAASAGITARRPVKLAAAPPELTAWQRSPDRTVQARAARIDRLLTWPGKPGAKPDP